MSEKSCDDTVFTDRNVSKQTDYSKERAHCKRLWAGYLQADTSLTWGLKQANLQTASS